MLNPQVWIERHVRFVGKWLQNTPDETAFFRRQIKDLLEKQGFNGVKVSPFDFLHPVIPSFVIRPISKLGMILEGIPIVKETAGSLIIQARCRG